MLNVVSLEYMWIFYCTVVCWGARSRHILTNATPPWTETTTIIINNNNIWRETLGKMWFLLGAFLFCAYEVCDRSSLALLMQYNFGRLTHHTVYFFWIDFASFEHYLQIGLYIILIGCYLIFTEYDLGPTWLHVCRNKRVRWIDLFNNMTFWNILLIKKWSLTKFVTLK